MKSTGIRRKVDDLGRVVIPAGIRRSLGIHEGDSLEVAVDGEHVILAKPTDRCVFCGSEDGPLESFRGRVICRPCVGSLRALDEHLHRAAATVAPDPAPAPAPAPAPEPAAAPATETAPTREAPVRHLAAAPAPEERADAAADLRVADERVAGVRDERREPYDPASTTAW